MVDSSSPTKRHLVFITHSLGGIVLKQILVYLAGSRQTRDSKLLEAISGAIFFGVPNHGMVIDHLIALASGWPNQYLIEDLKKSSRYLIGLEDSFSSLVLDKSFFWGYKTKESIIPVRVHADGTWTKKDPRCPRLKLVERESATRGLWKIPEQRHLTFQIDEDHSSMVKFASMHDPNLAIVINILSQIFERPLPEGIQGLDRQPDPPANLNSPRLLTSSFPSEEVLRRPTSGFRIEEDTASQENMGLSGNRIQNFKLISESANFPALEPFFGRGSELGSLANLLDRGPTSSQQFVYDNIFCLDGTTIERLRLTLRREANPIRQSWSDLPFKALKLADTHSGNIERFCTFLNSDGNDNWLFVIDELRVSSSWVTAIFERLKQGTIVLVSSSSQPAIKYPVVKLGPLERSPSIEMLLHYSPTPNLKATSEHYELLSALDNHPALIRLAVPKMLGFKTISYFLQNWNNGEIKLPSQMVTRIRGILEDEFCGGLPTSQKDLLEFCLLINHKAISYEFLEFLGFLELRDLELFFSDTIEHFARHGLLETRLPHGQTVTCSISAVLYQYLRQSIKRWPDNIKTGTRILAHKVPRSSKDNHRASLEILAPHTELFAKYIINTPKMVNPPASYLDNMERIATLLRLLGHDGDAIKLYGYIHQQNKETKTGRRVRLKLSHARTAELYNNMGMSCLNEGDVTFARSCFDKAIAALESGNLGDTNTMLEVVANVARANLDIEDYGAAERLLVDMLSEFPKRGHDSLLPLQLLPLQLLPLQHFLGFAVSIWAK